MTSPVTKIGKYQIIEQIGEGAMGVVYRAVDPVLNRTVAVKVMSEGLAHDESLRTRFLHEAQAAGSLQHPNIVTVYDFGETDGHLFIAMEYVQGADLEHLLQHSAPISLAAKLDIAIDILNGLSYAHRRGIVHRDIKPANIRVNEEGHARIMDFGVARLPTSNLTKTGVMMGTPNYMAPEQISGENVTASADLFSTGALLYELLTNVKPFEADTMHGVLFKIVSDPPPDVRALKPDLPIALSGIVMRSLAKTPGERFGSATEMANALAAVRATLGPARVSKTLASRVSHRSSLETALRDRSDAHENALADARRWRAVGVTAAALLGVAVIGLLLFRKQPESPAGASAPAAVPPATVVATGNPADTTARTVTPRPAPADSAPPPVSVAQGEKAAPPPAQQTAPREEPRRTASVSPPTERQRPNEQRRAAADTERRPADSEAARSAPPPTTPTQTAGAQPTSVPAAVTSSNPTPPTSSAPPVTSQPAGNTTAPVSAPQPVQTKAPEPDQRPAINAVVSAYARAIGTREVSEVRRVYPGMTKDQESAWNSFFSSVRSMVATFEIASLDVSGSTAVARLNGVYEYVSRAGRTQRQPVSLEATLQRDGERWRLQTVH